MSCFLKNLSPQNFTLSAVTAGFLLTADLDFESQDLLGGWLMLVGQLIQTNAAFAMSQLEQCEDEKRENKKKNEE